MLSSSAFNIPDAFRKKYHVPFSTRIYLPLNLNGDLYPSISLLSLWACESCNNDVLVFCPDYSHQNQKAVHTSGQDRILSLVNQASLDIKDRYLIPFPIHTSIQPPTTPLNDVDGYFSNVISQQQVSNQPASLVLCVCLSLSELNWREKKWEEVKFLNRKQPYVCMAVHLAAQVKCTTYEKELRLMKFMKVFLIPW